MTRIVLDLGCCPAGSEAAAVIRDSGGKAVVVAPAALGVRDKDGQASGEDLHAWTWQVADVLGIHYDAVHAGCPVPLASDLATWNVVRDEVGSDRWDAVVLAVSPSQVAALVEAPALLLRVLDTRLDRLASSIGDDPAAALEVATLLRVRGLLPDLVRTASCAVGFGWPEQHHAEGCDRPGGLGLASVDPGDVAGVPRGEYGVRAEAGGYTWWIAVAEGALPEVHREADRLLVEVAGQLRTFTLPGALARCSGQAARVVADRLEVWFEPDLDEWR